MASTAGTSVTTDLELDLFNFLCRKYVQRADARQKAMGLQYTEAETHDLAREIARFIGGLSTSMEIAKAFEEAQIARDEAGYLGSVADCIRHLSEEVRQAERKAD